MTRLALVLALARGVVVISALPVLIGLGGFRTRPPGFRILWGWLALGLAVNTAMWVASSQAVKTNMLTQLTFPLYATLGLASIGMLSGSALFRRWCSITAIGYLLFWGYRFLHDEAANDFSLYTGPVLWMILTVAAAALIRVRLLESPPSFLRDPVSVSALAVLVSFAPAAAIEPVSAAIYMTHPDLTLALWLVRTLLLGAGYLLFTMVFYWTLPPRSSPGFSSSVASPPAR